MAAIDIIKATIWEDSGCQIMARIVGNDAANIVQADITSITLDVYDQSSDTQTVTDEALTVASVVFDTLQTDARWTVDATGYNFRHTAEAAKFPTGGSRYRLEYNFNPASGENFIMVAEITAKSIRAT